MNQLGRGAYRARGLCGAIALLLTASPPSAAAVYQCQGADGGIVYSDSPCGADAKQIIVRPQPLISTPSAPVKRASAGRSDNPSTLAANTAAARDAAALQCQAREYQVWYQGQNPKPTREQSDVKMNQIVESCWLSTHLVTAADNVAVNPAIKTVHIKAPQAMAGAASMAGAPAGVGAPLQVSRSRQPEEAARWSNYYACRTQTFQEWSNSLGHAADDAETREEQARADSQCRAQFNIPSGAAAIVTD